jgi:DNA polymerase-1
MSAAADNGRVFLIDAHSLIFQVFHAIPAMTSPSGLPTNALFGFARDMIYLHHDVRPGYLICVFDRPGKTFRDDFYPEYKAQRAPTPDDLSLQLPLIFRMLEAMNIPVLGVDGFEADDVLATLATEAAAQDLEVYICTNDKDCRQLITDRVKLYNLRKRAPFDREALQLDWGITPKQVVDLQSLVGDSVDNVPGVPGIGVKTAAKLLQEFGTLENVLANIEKIPGAKKQENLRASAAVIERARKLVRLVTNVPMEVEWEKWRLRVWDSPRLLALFQEWGFRSFADIARNERNSNGARVPKPERETRPTTQGELFGANTQAQVSAPHPPIEATYHLINDASKFAGFFDALTKQKRFAIDVETAGPNPAHSHIVGMAFSWQPGEAWYLPLRAPESEPVLDEADTLSQLREVLEDPSVAKVNQNLKCEILALRGHGIRMANAGGDPMLADYLLHAGERSHGLDELASRYLDHPVIPITDLIGKPGKSRIRLDQVPAARVAQYAGEKADLAWRLCELLEPDLEKSGVNKLYDELEVPLIGVLADLEYNGIRLDVPLLRRLGQEMADQLAAIEVEIHELAGREFNIASPKQLRQILFDELNLPTQKRTGISGDASTDQETLERLAALGHELPRKIIEHRQIAKLKGTYVDALPDLVNRETGRIHASFNQTVAATGRLSSSDPNLQNIPVRTEQGRQIRQAFLPAEGWHLLAADYSQIELRLLAHFCEDAELRRAFAEDRDVHTSVAAQIFGVAEKEVTSDMRRMAKVVNFGVIYGMSAHGLAQRLGMPRDEAGRFIDAYFGRYPKVLDYQTRLLENCRKNRYVSTILGRRREITGIRTRSTYQQRNQPEREAVNMEIQGSAADLIKLAMLNIHRRLEAENRRTRMLLQIHDELVFEVPPEELDEMPGLIRDEMTRPLETQLALQVPLKADVAVGPNWLDVKEIPEAVASSAVL